MEKFWNRFKFYFIGLSFGSLLVYFMFGNRGCAWLPENRVKNMIGEKELVISDSLFQVLSCFNLSNVDIYELLKNKGEVVFDKSSTRDTPKVYFLEAENENGWYAAEFALHEETKKAEVVGLHKLDQEPCRNIETAKVLRVLSLPREDIMHIIEAQEIRILSKAKCQLACLNLNKDDVLIFHQTADIDLKASKPRLHPNPIYVLNGKINGETYIFTYIIGENRTRISDISSQTECDCEDL
tara:strand:+ start:40 stop:759 length:720 start_codon:yes stop_codon:yes gene_type:complete